MILPGETIGMLGGGQLGRMFCLEARRLGYRTVVWSGVEHGPSEPVEGVADVVLNKSFQSREALEEFCRQVAVATVEFENIPVECLRAVEERVPLRPSSGSVAVCQRRAVEKTFLRDHGIPCAPFAVVESLAELAEAYGRIGPEAVLKTAAFGYDGKGQVRLRKGDDPAAAWETLDGQRAVLEGFVDFACEISVLVARNERGERAEFPPAENEHRHHILDLSIVPARVEEKTKKEAYEIALRVAEALDYQGLLAVEFFVERSGSVLVNELAPRPHNSGHYTMDGCLTSQFEQQLRAVCGLPLGSPELLAETVMLNLLGDMWRGEPRRLDEAAVMDTEGAKLHLYGKSDPGERRKMGHVNLVGNETVLSRARALKEKLLGS